MTTKGLQDPVLDTEPATAMSHSQAYRSARQRLLAAQKSGQGVPAYTRYVNRAMGRGLAAGADVLGLTPNGVTGLSMLSSFAGITFMVCLEPSLTAAVVCGLLMVLGYALDAADGQLARLQARAGPSGEWLDHVSDQARQTAVHLAVVVYLYRFLEAPFVFIGAAMVYLVAVNTRFLSQILADQLRRAGAGSSSNAEDPAKIRRRTLLQLPSDPGVLCLAFFCIGNPMVFALTYGLLATANVVLTAASLIRRYKELSRVS